MKLKRIILTPILLLSFFSSNAQHDYTWWDVKHNWIPGTHWHEYITVAPGFMGPNALPVPEIQQGMTPERASFKFSLENHHSKGDQTQNIFTDLYLPLYSKKVGLRLYGVPFEVYEMDTLTRDLRKSRDRNGKGNTFGDLYIGTYIQLIEGHEIIPDVLLTINLKTASGDNLAAARFTDAPAYFFDISFGKTFDISGSFIQSIRPHTMLGFFAWQTYEDNRRQNDAVVFGFGFSTSISNWEINNSIGGYDGHNAIGDKSIVYRLSIKSNYERTVNYFLRFQEGFADFDYTSTQLGVVFNFGKSENEDEP